VSTMSNNRGILNWRVLLRFCPEKIEFFARSKIYFSTLFVIAISVLLFVPHEIRVTVHKILSSESFAFTRSGCWRFSETNDSWKSFQCWFWVKNEFFLLAKIRKSRNSGLESYRSALCSFFRTFQKIFRNVSEDFCN
jgi:hypothetical protein